MSEPTKDGVAASVRLRTLDMTCGACPSQWEGETDDGRAVYVRYRHGYLSVGVGSTQDDAVTAGWSPEINDGDGVLLHSEQVSEEDDGVMSTDEMLERTGLTYAS